MTSPLRRASPTRVLPGTTKAIRSQDRILSNLQIAADPIVDGVTTGVVGKIPQILTRVRIKIRAQARASARKISRAMRAKRLTRAIVRSEEHTSELQSRGQLV